MTDPTHESAPSASSDVPPPGMPRWVKASLLVVAGVLLIFLILKLTGVGSDHGPGSHQAGAPVLTPEAGGAEFGAVANLGL